MTDTTVTADAVAAAADRLLSAQAGGVPCPPVRDLIGPADVYAAYAVQQYIARARIADGRSVVGRKIGLTSEAVQAQLGVDQPDFGALFDDMQYADGAVVPGGSILQPRAEAEIAFVLRDDLAEGDLSLEQVRRAIDYAVADNASGGAFVLGRDRKRLEEFDPRAAVMSLLVDGVEV